MGCLAERQCRHPLQPMGGVCAMCLKERLSKISGLRCGPDAAATSSATIIDRNPLARESPATSSAPPLKQLLGQPVDLSHHADAAAEMPPQVMPMSDDADEADADEARQSIAYLIERDIVEARPRHSDGAPGFCYEQSCNQLPRSKSTSQLDAYYRLNGTSLHPVSSHRQLLSGTKRMTEHSVINSAVKIPFPHHDLQRGIPSPQCYGNGGMQMRFQIHEKTTLPLLAKSKSTGWILNHSSPAYDDNSRSERRSPFDLLSWHKRRKLSSALHASMEALMMSPWTRKIGGTSSSMKTTETMWRPLKILFRWRMSSGKPSFTTPMASSSTPRSSYSSSSSCTQCAAERRLHHDSISKRDDRSELENVMCGMCGCRIRRVLSHRRGHNALNAGGLDSVSAKLGVDASVEQSSRCLQKNVFCHSPDVGSMRGGTMSDDVLQSSAVEQGSRRRARILWKRGEGTGDLARGSELSDSPMSCRSKVMKGAKEVQVERSKSSPVLECSRSSSVSSSLPSLTKLFDASMMYNNSKVKPGNACVVSIAALISMDVNSTSPVKMTYVGNP